MFFFRLLFGFACLFIFTNCGTGSGSPVPPTELPSNDSPANTQITSNDLLDVESLSKAVLWNENPLVVLSESSTELCQVNVGNVSSSGICINPLNVKGTSTQVLLRDLSGTLGTNTSDPSILYTSDTTALVELGMGDFNFLEPTTMGGPTDLSDFDATNVWDIIDIETNSMDVTAFIKNQYWTVRFVFTSNPITLDSEVQGCGYTAEQLALMETSTRYLFTDMDVYRGDILLCRKDTLDDDCLFSSDWSWYDLDLQTFTNTRPTNPLQHDWTSQLSEICTSPESLNLSDYNFYGSFSQEFNLSATYDGCHVNFSYTDPSTSITTTGNTLNTTFDFTTEASVIIPSSSAYQANDTQLDTLTAAEVLNLITFKQMLIRSGEIVPTAIMRDAALNVNPTITITQDEDAPCADLIGQ